MGGEKRSGRFNLSAVPSRTECSFSAAAGGGRADTPVFSAQANVSRVGSPISGWPPCGSGFAWCILPAHFCCRIIGHVVFMEKKVVLFLSGHQGHLRAFHLACVTQWQNLKPLHPLSLCNTVAFYSASSQSSFSRRL